MKSFLERLAGGRRSFRDLGMGETAALSLSKGMRRGQGSPVNKSLKKQAREPWNERKGFMACDHFDSDGFVPDQTESMGITVLRSYCNNRI
jgi:hypothetical protein